MLSNRSAFHFLLFAIAIFFIALSPTLLSHGLFMDGVYYATIARNMAEGAGSFWAPQFTATLGKEFFDHPPLAFFLESIFFQLFGDHHWVEKLYSMLTYIISGSLIIIVWKKISPASKHNLYWLPLLLWLTVPKMIWGANNNLLENTVMIFVLASLLCQIKALENEKSIFFFFAGVFLFLGFITKGFTALFPLSFPFFYWLVKRHFVWHKLIRIYFLLLIGFLIPLTLLFTLVPESYVHFNNYFQIQLINGVNRERIGRGRFYIIRRATQELLPMIILTVLFYLRKKFFSKSNVAIDENKSWSIIFLATALSGVLPIMVSLKQSTFYIIPTFPLFSICFALLIASSVNLIVARIKPSPTWVKALSVFNVSLLVIGIILLFLPLNKIKRDKQRLSDINTIINQTGKHITLGLEKSMHTEWAYYAYFYRYGHISLTTETPYNFEYFVARKEFDREIIGFKKINLNLKSLSIYQRE